MPGAWQGSGVIGKVGYIVLRSITFFVFAPAVPSRKVAEIATKAEIRTAEGVISMDGTTARAARRRQTTMKTPWWYGRSQNGNRLRKVWTDVAEAELRWRDGVHRKLGLGVICGRY